MAQVFTLCAVPAVVTRFSDRAPSFRGDAESFERVVTVMEADVLRFCLRFVGDRGLAEDLAQEVFVTLWRERSRYREEGKLRAFLLGIARRRCLAALKKRRRDDVVPDLSWVAERRGGESGDALAVYQALSKLRPKYAELVVMRHLEGLSLEEIRELTGHREGTIKSRLHRAMAELRKEISDGE